MSYRAARNMAFQGLSPSRGEVVQLVEIDGASIVGTKVKAPFGVIPEVYVLPMESVKATKVPQCRSIHFYNDTQDIYDRELALSPPYPPIRPTITRRRKNYVKRPNTTR